MPLNLPLSPPRIFTIALPWISLCPMPIDPALGCTPESTPAPHHWVSHCPPATDPALRCVPVPAPESTFVTTVRKDLDNCPALDQPLFSAHGSWPVFRTLDPRLHPARGSATVHYPAVRPWIRLCPHALNAALPCGTSLDPPLLCVEDL